MLETLRQQLRGDLIAGAKWCVALSGGVDSTALLHALVQLGREFPANSIRAIHINHHLHIDADSWNVACQSLCDVLGVPLTCCDVEIAGDRDGGTEAAARKVRYGALISHLGQDEILLTAHHRDDQVETLLLRLLRGAGPHGLASIEPRRIFGRGWLVRPLLQIGRNELEVYAREKNLAWIEDPANIDTSFDRNFLRHRIIPILRERWPGLGETIPRAARLCGEAARMLDELAELDIAVTDSTIPIHALSGLSTARRRNVIRHWLRQRNLAPPAEAKLRDGLEQLMTAGPDRMPLLEWSGVQIRRYRGRLHILEFDPDSVVASLPDTYDWDGTGRIDFGPLRGGLRFVRDNAIAKNWVIHFRTGGERFVVGGKHKTIKNLFQERGVLPWMRAHVPLLYQADRLVAIGDLWQAEDIGADADGHTLRVAWDGHPSAL